MKWSRILRMWVAGMAMMCLPACSAANLIPAQPDTTSTPLPDEFHAEMFAKRTLWRQQNIPHYLIRFEFVEDMTKPVITQRDVYIGNYAVRGVKCPTGACPTAIFRDLQTVNDVYSFMQRIPESCIDHVRYDPYLYYPAYVSADCADGIAHPFSMAIIGLYPGY